MQKIHLILNRTKNNQQAELKKLILAVQLTAFFSILLLASLGINRTEMVILSSILLLSIMFTLMGYVNIGSWVTLSCAFGIFSALVFQHNGIRDTAIMGLIVILIVAGLLAGKNGTIVIGTLIIVEIVAYGILEKNEILSNSLNISNYFTDYLALCLAVGLVTLFQWAIIDQLNKNIQEARYELGERTKIQKQLQEAESQYRELVETMPLVLFTAELGAQGKWFFVSQQITNLTGFQPHEWLTQPNLWYSRVHPEDRDYVVQQEYQAIQTGKTPKLEYRLLTQDDRWIWIYDECTLISIGTPPIVRGFLLEITSRKQAEEQLTSRIAELQAVHGISETLIKRNDLQNLIYETGEQIRLAFKANNVLIAIHDQNTNLIHFPYDYEDGTARPNIPIHYGQGMTTYIMKSKQPLSIENEWITTANKLNAIHTNRISILSSFSVPIIANDRALGVITLESSEREYAFSNIDTRPLLTIASNLAVAIEKTRLQDSLKKELEIQEKLIRELELKNEELERFTYTASHDLKSPLITIRGFLGYLERDARKGNFERLNADIQRISEATEKMHRLLTELLELSRIGRVASEKHHVPFEVIVKEALSRVEGQINASEALIRTGSGFPTIFVDKERLIEVVQNLIDNALKFTSNQRPPDIEINYYMNRGQPVFYVRDNGLGIKPEFQQRIFGLFDKLDPTSEGTGVGLALVKRIIEVHGGEIWVESEEGKGSTFYFTVAKTPPQ